MKTGIQDLKNSGITEGVALTPTEATKFLVGTYQAGNFHRTPFFKGPPGCGKTALVREAARQLAEVYPGFKYIEINPTMPADEVGGIPDLIRQEGKPTVTDYALPKWYPRAEDNPDLRAIICLDDVAQGDKIMQQTLANLILARNLRANALPKGVMIVATGNRKEDKAGVSTMLTHLADRMCHITIKPDVVSWIENFAIPRGLNSKVIAYHRWDGERLNRFDPDAEKCPTSRSWEAVSGHMQYIESLPIDKPEDKAFQSKMALAILAGELGLGEGSRFWAHCTRFDQLPDLDYVLANPSTANVDYELDIRDAIARALAQRMDASNFSAILEYVDRLGPDFTTLVLQIGTKNRPELRACPAFTNWSMKNLYNMYA